MLEALRRLLNRRYQRRDRYGAWNHRCGCQRCSLHTGHCPFPENGERYKRYGILNLCTACALNRTDLTLDRPGYGAESQWDEQQADFGNEGVF